MRVLHIVPALFGNNGIVGGAERYVMELARHMSMVTPTKLLSFGKQSRQEIVGNLNIRVLDNVWYVRGQNQNPFSKSIIKELLAADVIHCHQQHILASSFSALIARITGKKVFVTDLGGGGWDISGYISTDNWYHGHLHISNYSKKIFKHSDNATAHVIYGGIDTEKFSPDAQIKKENYVLFVGRQLAHKGINYLISAMPPDLKLMIVGQPYDEKYHKDLLALAKDKQVIFRHDCNDQDLVQAYRQALCIVLPSVYRTMYNEETLVPELLGQTLLEGMACGIPAICTDVASMPEIVNNNINGFVVPPNDPVSLQEKIIWLSQHPQQSSEFGIAARNRVLDHFSWPQVVARCLAIYQNRK